MEYLIYGSTHSEALRRPAPEEVRWDYQAKSRKLSDARVLARHYGQIRKMTAVRIFRQGSCIGRMVEEIDLT